jgi:hypothetical protein
MIDVRAHVGKKEQPRGRNDSPNAIHDTHLREIGRAIGLEFIPESPVADAPDFAKEIDIPKLLLHAREAQSCKRNLKLCHPSFLRNAGVAVPYGVPGDIFLSASGEPGIPLLAGRGDDERHAIDSIAIRIKCDAEDIAVAITIPAS